MPVIYTFINIANLVSYFIKNIIIYKLECNIYTFSIFSIRILN